MTELNETMSGRAVTVRVAGQLRIVLLENTTTGYRWRMGDDCNAILTVDEDQANPGNGQPGAGGEHIWMFTAKQVGHCELRFESARPWETGRSAKTVSFPITVIKAD